MLDNRHGTGASIGPGRNLLIVLVLLLAPVMGLASADLKGVRLKERDDRTRVVLDLSAAPTYQVFSLDSPLRLVVDLADSEIAAKPSARGGPVSAVRTGVRGNGWRRIVLDLEHPVHVRHFALAPKGSRGHRIVLDLLPNTQGAIKVERTEPPEDLGTAGNARDATEDDVAASRSRPWVVVIDPGHGGKDSGAVGRKRTYEKRVVLEIATRLRALIDHEPGMRAVLTRTSDRYLKLRQRIDVARDRDADLFVSIHADSFRNRDANGSSVFVLSRRGASSEAARWLASRENAADLVGGVTLNGVDKQVQSVVLNMLQDHTIGDSWDLAGQILRELKTVGPVHKPGVERAGFVVLKSPDIPSVLVETAFLSNPKEEAKLRNPVHQQRLAEAIFRGIRGYVDKRAPRRDGGQVHQVQKGETLGGIARQYHVKLSTLRKANDIRGDHLSVGDTLTIPAGS